MTAESRVPADATAIRLVRPVADDLREYEAMGSESGSRGIALLMRRQMVEPGDYGLADLLNDNGDIVGEIELDRTSFQRLRRKLRCRVIHTEARSSDDR